MMPQIFIIVLHFLYYGSSSSEAVLVGAANWVHPEFRGQDLMFLLMQTIYVYSSVVNERLAAQHSIISVLIL